jgi:adenylate cyclase
MKRLEKIKFDLDEYKIILQFHGNKQPLIIHFDTPSRRFYFSVIALIVNEMKKLGDTQYIQLQKYKKQLKLLDDSISGRHASKNMEGMLAKIRVAWRNRLPNLETAPLFKILDRNLIPPYEKGGKFRYECSDLECDIWANLFSYDDNNTWRFRFAVDSVSITLNDTIFSLGHLKGDTAWNEFLVRVSRYPKSEVKDKNAFTGQWKGVALALIALSIVGILTLSSWYFYDQPGQLKTQTALLEKPSIAVLPFENMSGDPKKDYFSEGLTEQIISTLSRFRTLFVISGGSTSTYKGKTVKIQKVAEDLGVKYVLKGSVQTSADQIRITVQLIDATTGHYIWSQRYDRQQKEIFAIQDDITLEITKALQADIMSGEQARLWDKTSTTNLEAWEKYLKADDYYFRFTKEDNATARRLLEEVIVLDPEYAFAYVMLGWTYWMDARFGWVDSRAEYFKVAGKYAQKGMELNDSLDTAYLLMGSVYWNQGQFEKAIAEVERAITLNPNGANNYSALAAMVGGLGRWNESIELAKKSIRLHPFAPATFYHWLGRAYFMTGQYDEAIATLKKILQKNPNYLPAHAFLAACYSSSDRHAEAAAEANEVRRINPKFNLESYAKTMLFKKKADKERYIAALRKAGLT